MNIRSLIEVAIQVIKKVTKLLETSPLSSAALLTRARLYFGISRFDQVIEDTRWILKMNPKHVAALLLRGHAYKYEGELTMALKHYQLCAKQFEEECEEAKASLEAFQQKLEEARTLVSQKQATRALTVINEALAYDQKLTFFQPELNLLKCTAYVIVTLFFPSFPLSL